MATTYTPASQSVLDTMAKVIAKHFPDLTAAKVNIEVLMAENPTGAAVKLHGAACLAKIRVIKGEDRAMGAADERIIIDAKRYTELKPRRREALFFHELNHIIVPRDDDTNEFVTDDYGRPATKHRPDDWVISGFQSAYDVYNTDSVEWHSYQTMTMALRQTTMPFVRDEPDQPEDDADDDTPIAGSTARREASA